MSSKNILEKSIDLIPGLANLAPFALIVEPNVETSMIGEYDKKDTGGHILNPFKIGLKGQEGIYHDLGMLIGQLNLWFGNGIEFVDLRFSVVQPPHINAGKFTVLIIPVSSTANPDGSRNRIPQDGTDFTKSVDLGDLHP